MSNWYVLSIVALVLMGTQRFLYKVSAEKKCPTAWTTFAFMATVALISGVALLVTGEALTNWRELALIAVINSGSFVLGTLTHIEALKHIPTSVVYPIIRLNMVVVILFSIIYFHDHISVYQIFGILFAIAVIILLTRDADEHRGFSIHVKKGLMLVFVSLFSGAISSISSKFAAMAVDKLGFMTLSYTMGTLFSLGMAKRMGTQEAKKGYREAFLIGFAMGLINFLGFYLFLKALSLGPLSVIVTITGMHFVIAIFLSVLIYGEKLDALKMLGIGLTILSLLLLKL